MAKTTTRASKKKRSLIHTYSTDPASVGAMTEALSEVMHNHNLNEKLIFEYQLLLESVVAKITEKTKDARLSVQTQEKSGTFSISLRYTGLPIELYQESEDDIDGRIFEEYRDYLSCEYYMGETTVLICFFVSDRSRLRNNLLTLLLSFPIAALLVIYIPANQLELFSQQIVQPLIELMVRCLQQMAMPLVFFSVSSLIVQTNHILRRDPSFRTLSARYILSSLCCVGIAYLSCFAIFRIIPYASTNTFHVSGENPFGSSLDEMILNFVPNNIIDPFLSASPIPILFTAILLGVASCKLRTKDGAALQKGITTINNVFSFALTLVYKALPFFLFCSQLFLNIYYFSRKEYWHAIPISMLAVFLIPMLLVCVYYAIRLACSGISPLQFWRENKEILKINLRIGSNINALPYNLREMNRKFKVKREFLRTQLELGVSMNMDGNCAMVTTAFFAMCAMNNVTLDLRTVLLVVLLIVLLSVGAPNQYGSFMISMIILFDFVGLSHALLAQIVIVDVFTGNFFSALNSIGDIVSITLENRNKRIQ